MRSRNNPRLHSYEPPLYRRASRRGAGGREISVSRIYRLSGRYHRREVVVPYIRMSGHWLQRLGFRFGDRIFIAEEPGRLILTVAKHDSTLAVN